MPKAASRLRKPKPLAMLWRRRLTIVLLTKNAISAAITATNNTCRIMPRSHGSRHGAGRLCRTTTVALSVATATPPLTDRHGVHQPALGPQIVVAAFELQRRAKTEIAVEYLAVIANQFDGVVGPLLVEPERLAHARSGAEHALDGRIVALEHIVDISLVDAALLALDQGIDDPIDNIVPLLVAVPHDRGQRLLRDALRHDDV